MALSNAAMIVAANALRSGITHAALHTGDPGAAGTSNQATSGVEAVAWGAASGDGDFSLSSSVAFTGGASGGPCTYVSLWDGATGPGTDTFMGAYALSGDQTFNAAGEYTLNALTVNGSAS